MALYSPEDVTVYISGPMSGIPFFNLPAFDAAQRDLREAGFNAWIPADFDTTEETGEAMMNTTGAASQKEWATFLARDIAVVATGMFDAVVVLPGWTNSRGAMLETYLAYRIMGIPVLAYAPDLAKRVRGIPATLLDDVHLSFYDDATN